jgi:hypothetical protein
MVGKLTVSQAPAAYGEYRSSGVGELDSELVTVTVTVSDKAGSVISEVTVDAGAVIVVRISTVEVSTTLVKISSVEFSTTISTISTIEVLTTVVRISRVEIIVVSMVDEGAVIVTVDADAEAVTVMIDAEARRVSIVVEVKSSVTTAPEAVILTSLILVIITVETEIDVTVERLGHVEDVEVVEFVVDPVAETELEVVCTSE